MNDKPNEKRSANRIRIGFLAAFVLLLLSNALSYISTQKVNEQAEWVNHTDKVIHDLDNLNSYVIRSEASLRGYLIDLRKKHPRAFNTSVRKIDSVSGLIKQAVADNPKQIEGLDTLGKEIKEVLASIQNRFDDFNSTSKLTPEIIKETEYRDSLMMDIESRIERMQQNERQSWNERSVDISEYSFLIKFLSIISMLLAIVLTLYSTLVFNKENKARQEADQQTELFKEQLRKRVNQLAELNSELIELRSLEKYFATGRIARTIAHEVRNPLTNINLAAEQLKTDFQAGDGSEMFFDMIKRNSDRINKLVSDLLNSTRPTELKKTDTDINKLLDESLCEAQDRIKLEHIKVVKNYNKEILPIPLDAERIKIAFLNFIVNALEAMQKGGILSLETLVEAKKYHIKISDTGCGMSREQIGRLFEPFFTTKSTGNGLGLPNSQNIILNHNGNIKVESEEGKGTTFHIYFDIPDQITTAPGREEKTDGKN